MNIAVIELAASIAVFRHADGCRDRDNRAAGKHWWVQKRLNAKSGMPSYVSACALSRTRQKTDSCGY
ncbi:MAG: hypothetical protein J0G95_16680 [Rhizobiales bacterium]|nr:hypothetical protein [Hyphomicrobiales bacterium]